MKRVKLILKCNLSPGDIVMLTAAVRDLHYWYPGRFLTDVRTLCPELWEHNPHLVRLADDDPDARPLDCSYPLIDQCNRTPYHCLHGFIAFLNDRLRLRIRPTAFKGDLHLSAQEKAWYSQVHEVTRRDVPFWIVSAGGKHDITLKWWPRERYQAVIDHFRGKIQFVQIGQAGDHHPRLEGVIDLRGQTSLRELIRLVYHAQGVLCPVTALMHLAAAVETKTPQAGLRPCVVIAGGREPVHWEAYPGHQFIHTLGALACCAEEGCWKDRAFPLRDGDMRDHPSHRCANLTGRLARCLDLITPQTVIERIELFFQGGQCRFLAPDQRRAARLGVKATSQNNFEQQTLTLSSAGLACDQFVRELPEQQDGYAGRGLIVCGGGVKYFPAAWVCVNMLRRLGCSLPIQLWHLGPGEVGGRQRRWLAALGVESVDALQLRRQFPVRILHGWELKAYALVHCTFQEVLLLDADNVPVLNPELLFDAPPYVGTGAVFWPDNGRACRGRTKAIWRSCGLADPKEAEFESGQILVNKAKCWRALRLALWFNEQSDFYYHHIHGDKETFHLAFRKLAQPYTLVSHPLQPLMATMCQHAFDGRRLFQHRNLDKWRLSGQNHRIEGFLFEAECRAYLKQLRRLWFSGAGAVGRAAKSAGQGG